MEIHYNYNSTFVHFVFSAILCTFCFAQMPIRMMFPIFYTFLVRWSPQKCKIGALLYMYNR
jgi:hypothetical protein